MPDITVVPIEASNTFSKDKGIEDLARKLWQGPQRNEPEQETANRTPREQPSSQPVPLPDTSRIDGRKHDVPKSDVQKKEFAVDFDVVRLGVGVGLVGKALFVPMPIAPELRSEISLAATKVNQIWVNDLDRHYTEMARISKNYPIGTSIHWKETSVEHLWWPKVGYRPNPGFVALPPAETAIRAQWKALNFPAASNGHVTFPELIPQEFRVRIPPEGVSIIESSVGKISIGTVFTPHASPELAGASKEWNSLAMRHNDELGKLRQDCGRAEVGAFVLGQVTNAVMDNYMFSDTPTSWRTSVADFSGMALMMLPCGRPLSRAAGMVGVHLAARAWDYYDHRGNR